MAAKTIFTRIIDREVPADIVYEDEQCLAFRDINAQAPVHVLVIPKKPIPAVSAIGPDDTSIMAHLWQTIPRVASDLGLESGYRVVVNCGHDAGQTVDHLHFHILGGRQLSWPPG
jgi:histidine triad (HIT) family protein